MDRSQSVFVFPVQVCQVSFSASDLHRIFFRFFPSLSINCRRSLIEFFCQIDSRGGSLSKVSFIGPKRPAS